MPEKLIQKMDITEFRKSGLLQEANRLFFHPRGLALEITIDDDEKESLSGVWDYRNDPIGIEYDLVNSDEERIDTFKLRAEYTETLRQEKLKARQAKFGTDDGIEPIPEEKKVVEKANQGE